MALGEPLGYFNFWERVRVTAPWPQSNEDLLYELGAAWSSAGGDYATLGSPGETGLRTAWPDPAGQDYAATIDDVKAETRAAAGGMKLLGTLTDTYAYEVAYTKNQVVQTIISNVGYYVNEELSGRGEEYVGKVADAVNRYYDEMASRIAARGAGGDPREGDNDIPTIDEPDVLPDWIHPRTQLGANREQRVAEIVGGTVIGKPGELGLPISGADGDSDVDVIGQDGTFIQVGGEGKVKDIANTERQLKVLREAAAREGVPAQAYFEEGTPYRVILLARKILGRDNVYTFEP